MSSRWRCAFGPDLLCELVNGLDVVVVEASLGRQQVQEVQPEPGPHRPVDEVAAHSPRRDGREENSWSAAAPRSEVRSVSLCSHPTVLETRHVASHLRSS